jgi:hypothetical protein
MKKLRFLCSQRDENASPRGSKWTRRELREANSKFSDYLQVDQLSSVLSIVKRLMLSLDDLQITNPNALKKGKLSPRLCPCL